MANFGQIGAVVAVSALLGLGVAGVTMSQINVPSPEAVAVNTVGAPTVVIDDPHDLLTPDDEARLTRDAQLLDAPDTVRTLHWIVFNESDENINDTVENFMRDNYPDEIGADHFADGVLIIGAGTQNRKVFTFAGLDVLEQLHLKEGERLEAVNEEIKPGMRDNNIPGALLAGARAAMDAQDIQQYELNDAQRDRVMSVIGAGAAAGGLSLAVGSIAVAMTNSRRNTLAQGREDYELVTREYSQLAQRLNEIDVRANSLTSAFADNEMRKQWAEVRDRFLNMHDAVSGAGGIGSIDIGDDKQVLANKEQLADAAEAVRHTNNAEDNINRMFKVENGDAAARRSDLTAIREDLMQARLEIDDAEIEAEIAQLEARVNELDRNPTAPDFMDSFVRVLGDYRTLLEVVKRTKFSDVEERNELQRPALYDSNFYYSGYVPFVVMSSWHSSNVQAAQSSSSSGTNTSFSSGFSGGGGSSSY